MTDSEIEALCEDIDRYYEERGGCPNHTDGEEASDARATAKKSFGER